VGPSSLRRNRCHLRTIRCIHCPLVASYDVTRPRIFAVQRNFSSKRCDTRARDANP
jgi:hypothetical protein